MLGDYCWYDLLVFVFVGVCLYFCDVFVVWFGVEIGIVVDGYFGVVFWYFVFLCFVGYGVIFYCFYFVGVW